MPQIRARTLLRLLVPLMLAGACADAAAQPYPTKPIRLVVGFPPGGAADYVARAISEPLGRALGVSIVVENRAGAGSSIAADYVSKSAPDGYTMLIASPSSISVNPALNPKLGYSLRDGVKQAFAREGTETAASHSSEEFAAVLAEDAKFWVRLVKESGAKLD